MVDNQGNACASEKADLAEECAQFFTEKRQARLSKEMIIENYKKLKKIALQLSLDNETTLMQQALKGNAKSIRAIESLLLRSHHSFFEGAGMYKAFENLTIPHLINKNAAQKKISIWVPACAEGQEAYSLALLLHSHKHSLQDWKLQIHATDTDNLSLKEAETAAFDKSCIDETIFNLYGKGLKNNGDEYIITSSVRNLVTFQQCNFYDTIPSKEPYDAIVFRNQLKYWNPDFQEKIIQNFDNALHPHGLLILAYGESLLGLTNKFQLFGNTQGFYQKII